MTSDLSFGPWCRIVGYVLPRYMLEHRFCIKTISKTPIFSSGCPYFCYVVGILCFSVRFLSYGYLKSYRMVSLFQRFSLRHVDILKKEAVIFFKTLGKKSCFFFWRKNPEDCLSRLATLWGTVVLSVRVVAVGTFYYATALRKLLWRIRCSVTSVLCTLKLATPVYIRDLE
jgi:hypothetical protein